MKQPVIANGMVGRAYCSKIDPRELSPDSISDYMFEGLEELGLTYNWSTHTIEGTPLVEGNHLVRLVYRLEEEAEDSTPRTFEIPLLINPDPKSLWKSVPSDSNDPLWKPDDFVSVVREADTQIVAASRRGRSHAHEGIFRDDDFSIEGPGKNGWSIIAVGDGAGSARLSRRGSQVACSSATSYLSQYLPGVPDSLLELALRVNARGGSEDSKKALQDFLYNALARAAFAAYKAIQDEAAISGGPIRDYSTTLLLVIHKRLSEGHFIGGFAVGDGAIGVYDKGNTVTLLGDPDTGEFAGQTRFLTMPEVFDPKKLSQRLRFTLVERFTSIIAVTDGITDPLFPSENSLRQVKSWDQLWSNLTSSVRLDLENVNIELELLSWLDFWSPGNHDDRTIAILTNE